MSGVLEKLHPILGIPVRSNGQVFLKGRWDSVSKWTYGSPHTNGYLMVSVHKRLYLVHRLVVETFIDPIPKGMEVDHLDRNVSNNDLSNLRVCSHKENMRNTKHVDACQVKIGIHKWQDFKEWKRRQGVSYRKTLSGKASALKSSRKQDLKHKLYFGKVTLSDNRRRWLLKEDAKLFRKIPKEQRTLDLYNSVKSGLFKLDSSL